MLVLVLLTGLAAHMVRSRAEAEILARFESLHDIGATRIAASLVHSEDMLLQIVRSFELYGPGLVDEDLDPRSHAGRGYRGVGLWTAFGDPVVTTDRDLRRLAVSSVVAAHRSDAHPITRTTRHPGAGTGDRDRVLLSRPIHYDGEFAGIAGVEIPMDHLLGILAGLKTWRGVALEIVHDADGPPVQRRTEGAARGSATLRSSSAPLPFGFGLNATLSETTVLREIAASLFWFGGVIVAGAGVLLFLSFGIASRERRIEQDQKAALRSARMDPLTGIGNRLAFREALSARARGARRFGLLMMDLDRFKDVNDTLGHAVGDVLLRSVAMRLAEASGPNGAVFRLGGDEFAVIVSDPDGGTSARLATTVRSIVEKPIAVDDQWTTTTTSVGIAVFPDDALDAEQLQRFADIALYEAKRGAGLASFDQGLRQVFEEQVALKRDLREAIDQGRIVANYQPIVDARTGRVVSFEALARWTDPRRGPVRPDSFIAVAEEAGLIGRIGETILRQACAGIAALPADISVAVNVSPLQLQHDGLVETVLGALAESGIAPERLELEVTENALLRAEAATLDRLQRLRESGIRIVLDDFGAGYSSLRHLIEFPWDKVKIDRSIVRPSVGSGHHVLRSVLGMVREMGLVTVAEGIETLESGMAVRELGCDLLQGFYFGRPVPRFDIAPGFVFPPALQVVQSA